MVAVIFLDIDGVICCNLAGRLEDNKLAQLQRVVQATSAKVCLSTDWRRQAQLKRQVVAALKKLTADADPKVREAAAKCFWLMHARWTEAADAVHASLEPAQHKLLKRTKPAK